MATDPSQSPDGQATGATPPVSNRSALLIVFIVVFIDLLGFGIVLPLLPIFANQYVARLTGSVVSAEGGAGDLGRDPIGGLIVGLLMSSFSLMQFIFAPIWGRISDRVGRRPILLLGLAGSVVFYALFGYALSLSPQNQPELALALLFAARIGAGIAGATISTAQAVIADCTPPEKRKHGMAIIGAAFGMGFTFGPLLAYASMRIFDQSYPLETRHAAIGYTAAGLSFVALLLGFRLMPETRRFDVAATEKGRPKLATVFRVLRDPGIGPVILTFFLATLGFGSFEATLAMLLEDVLGLKRTDEDRIFLIFALIGFVLLITQGLIYRRLAKYLSEATFMALGIVFMAAGVAGLGGISWMSANGVERSQIYVPLYSSLVAAVMGFAFLTPSAQALVSRRTDPNRQGEILGVNQSASAMARILGPVLGVTLYKSTTTHLLPFIFGSVLLVLMLPLIPRIRRG